jgi:hypothetical protein
VLAVFEIDFDVGGGVEEGDEGRVVLGDVLRDGGWERSDIGVKGHIRAASVAEVYSHCWV